MKNTFTLIILFAFLSSCGTKKQSESESSSFVTIEGVELPTKLNQGDTELVLNGAGVRSKFYIKVYVGGLYLPAKTHNAEEIINNDEPSIIRMVAVSRAFTNKKMSETVREKFTESAEGNVEPYQSRIDLLCSMLDTATFNKGDYCDIWYVPNEGIKVFRNGSDLNILVKGLDFKQMLFTNWLSEEHPADMDLRKGMLGLKE